MQCIQKQKIFIEKAYITKIWIQLTHIQKVCSFDLFFFFINIDHSLGTVSETFISMWLSDISMSLNVPVSYIFTNKPNKKYFSFNVLTRLDLYTQSLS